MPDPVRPEDVPDDLAGMPELAMARAALGREGLRTALAAVLTGARTQVADFACGEPAMTNAEITDLIAEIERGLDGDALAVCLAYVRRLIEAWPGGYGA